MKCTNRKTAAALLVALTVSAMGLTGCGSLAYEMPYQPDSEISSFNVIEKQNPGIAVPFAENLCIVTEDMMSGGEADAIEAEAAVLFDVNHSETLHSKNAHERLYPASLTKVMTALVALKYGSMDQGLTATNSVNITESGAQLCGLKPGDTMTLNQALHILLINSANDAAMLIAEGVAGSVDGFVAMMNEEAHRIGATNTNFMNPHGLSDEEHYTTAYDLYLIFNEALKYDLFTEIISMKEYQTTYHDKEGKEKNFSCETFVWFMNGKHEFPDSVTVVGGKTGTTNAAGHCLVLLSRDSAGAPYISVILRSASRDVLYGEMSDLLEQIQK